MTATSWTSPDTSSRCRCNGRTDEGADVMAGDPPGDLGPFDDMTDTQPASTGRRARATRRENEAWRTWLPYVGGILASLVTTVIVVVLVMEYTTGKTTLQIEI